MLANYVYLINPSKSFVPTENRLPKKHGNYFVRHREYRTIVEMLDYIKWCGQGETSSHHLGGTLTGL